MHNPLCRLAESTNHKSFQHLNLHLTRLIQGELCKLSAAHCKLVLVLKSPLQLWRDSSQLHTFAPEMPYRWLALLYTNRQIYDEASAVVYSSNRFTLVDSTQEFELLQSFLTSIGSTNAGFLSHLCISFPVLEAVGDESGTVNLSKESLQSLVFLQRMCTGLKTIETLIFHQNSGGLRKASEDNLEFVEKAISQIDHHLRAIPSLKEFVVRIYDRNVTSSVRAVMQRPGWKVFLGDEKNPV